MIIVAFFIPLLAQASTHSLLVTFKERSFSVTQTAKQLEVKSDYRNEKLSLVKCDRKKKSEALWREVKKSLAKVPPLEKPLKKGAETVRYSLDGKVGKILPYGKTGTKVREFERKFADFILFAQVECKK